MYHTTRNGDLILASQCCAKWSHSTEFNRPTYTHLNMDAINLLMRIDEKGYYVRDQKRITWFS